VLLTSTISFAQSSENTKKNDKYFDQINLLGINYTSQTIGIVSDSERGRSAAVAHGHGRLRERRESRRLCASRFWLK
jgi:hypothetical protein